MSDKVNSPVPDGIQPIDWLFGMMLCIGHGYTVEESEELVKDAVKTMKGCDE